MFIESQSILFEMHTSKHYMKHNARCHVFSMNIHQNSKHNDQIEHLQTLYDTLLKLIPIQTQLNLTYEEWPI